MPRKHKPTPEQRDERVNTEEPAHKLIQAVLNAGPHPIDEGEKRQEKPQRKRKRPPSSRTSLS